MNNLPFVMREAAFLYAAQNTDKPAVAVFSRWDGMDIPASTRIVVTVMMEHLPDEQITPELEMAAAV